MNWSKRSWRDFSIKQQPFYKDKALLKEVEDRLATYPSLIFSEEADKLKNSLKDVSQGKAFLLQGGDCAESFINFNTNNIKNFFKLMLQINMILMYGTGKSIVKIGRIAGQFAKPRSSDFEEKNGITLPSYRGDIINNINFKEKDREPDPLKMIQAYNQSSATINLLRAFARGGLADLNRVNQWNFDFIKDYPFGKKYDELSSQIDRTMKFISACGINSSNTSNFNQTMIYTSHEALLLNYEEAFTRKSDDNGKYYNHSAHMLWIGERTRNLNEAHIEYFKGIENPIGCKISNAITEDELMKLIDTLNPNNEEGKLNLIIRMGKNNILKYYPNLLERVKKEGRNIVWSSDPMHGNIEKSSSGYKTRDFSNILLEVENFFKIHQDVGIVAGGIHLEMTGNDVTECTGSDSCNITAEDLSSRYHTQCDPRLNVNQALELSFKISEMINSITKY